MYILTLHDQFCSAGSAVMILMHYRYVQR